MLRYCGLQNASALASDLLADDQISAGAESRFVETSSMRPGSRPALRVISWNVARRSSRLAEQAAALASREPDVVALQEITDTTLPLWRAVLERIGLPHIRAGRWCRTRLSQTGGSLRAIE